VLISALAPCVACREVPGPAGDDFGQPVTTSVGGWRLVSRHRPTQLVTGGPKSSPWRVDQRAGAVRRLPGGAGPRV